ncbi:MAG: antitoxin [Actinomycetota bacterium]|jgi:hypothetical protein|nr:antitoxin [Actinomycetota bacterium]
MRTTLTLDPDVMRLITDAVHRDRRTMKDVVNSALREALSGPRTARPFVSTPHHSGLQPGIDTARLNQLADELEDEHVLERLSRR